MNEQIDDDKWKGSAPVLDKLFLCINTLIEKQARILSDKSSRSHPVPFTYLYNAFVFVYILLEHTKYLTKYYKNKYVAKTYISKRTAWCGVKIIIPV